MWNWDEEYQVERPHFTNKKKKKKKEVVQPEMMGTLA